MIFRMEPFEDRELNQILSDSMKELNSFYGINWNQHIPRLVVVPNRKTVELWKQGDNHGWITGWLEGRSVYVVDRTALQTEANKTAETDQYRALIKHELSHAFYNIVAKGGRGPVWLQEGVAVYSSGQNSFRTRPAVFHQCLEFYSRGGKDVYTESGYMIQLLVDTFGKKTLLNLIGKTKEANSPEEFDHLFESIYGSKPTYQYFNNLSKNN